MGRTVSAKIFAWCVSNVLLHADATIKSRVLGIRENNPETLWIKNDVIDLIEQAFGKALFSPEYSSDKVILDDDLDYFGLISKVTFMDELINLYVRQAYRKDMRGEIGKAAEAYVQRHAAYCTKLLCSVYAKRMLELVKDVAKLALSLSGMDKIVHRAHRENRRSVFDYYKNRRFGLVFGVNLKSQYNYLLPIFRAFNDSRTEMLYIRGAGRDVLEKKDWGYVWNIKFPGIVKTLGRMKNRSCPTYRADRERLVKRIMSADIEPVYKQWIIRRLDGALQEYYTYKHFLTDVLDGMSPCFVQVQPERSPLQRTLLMLVRKRNIPTITYNPLFNMGNGIIQWSYLANWMLVANKNFAGLLRGKGFPESRIKIVGSTLVDYSFEKESTKRAPKEHIDILLLTKPAYKTISNDSVIESVFAVTEKSGINYRLFIKPHPFDRDAYKRFTKKYDGRVVVMERGASLYKCIDDKDIIIICGISGTVMECLPSRKPIVMVDVSTNVDKSYMYRKDIRDIVPLFENLEDFRAYLGRTFSNMMMKQNNSYEIPQSIIDDFYYRLDGNTANRICDFVYSKIGNRHLPAGADNDPRVSVCN
ncbi:MAG: hypothetical protein M1147_01015 [Nitrospirae bacterium]|nr:hypothetical protein [Nitrospirota bacterium]MCL5976690.1 hypothetical protein [Nitrospirota bacterium]